MGSQRAEIRSEIRSKLGRNSQRNSQQARAKFAAKFAAQKLNRDGYFRHKKWLKRQGRRQRRLNVRAPCTFRQSDAKRLMKAARDAGLSVQRVEVGPDGKITVVVGEPPGPNGGQDVNEWDQEGGRER
jgi:hypothetical protein